MQNYNRLEIKIFYLYLGLKKKLFVSCNGPKKNRVGRWVKKNLCIIFLVKNVCFSVLCMFYDDWELGGQEKL